MLRKLFEVTITPAANESFVYDGLWTFWAEPSGPINLMTFVRREGEIGTPGVWLKIDHLLGARVWRATREACCAVGYAAYVSVSPDGRYYYVKNWQTYQQVQPGTLCPFDPPIAWPAAYWTNADGTQSIEYYATTAVFDSLADLAVVDAYGTVLYDAMQLGVHRLSTGRLLGTITLAGSPIEGGVFATSGGVGYAVADNGVITVFDYVNRKTLGVLRQQLPAGAREIRCAFDPTLKRLYVLATHTDEAGKIYAVIHAYLLLPLATHLTPPIPLKAPRVGRTVPVLVRAVGDAGEPFMGKQIDMVYQGAGANGFPAQIVTDHAGYARGYLECLTAEISETITASTEQ